MANAQAIQDDDGDLVIIPINNRYYVRNEDGICCYSNQGVLQFSFAFSIEHEKMLMDDLYYGEYTGG